jgi:hypothetical protein
MPTIQLMEGVMCLLCLPGTSTNLREEQVNPKWPILISQEALQLSNLFAEHIRCVAYTANNTETACICNGGSELGPGGDVHSSQKNGMVDLQEVGDRSPDLLCLIYCQ